MATNTSYLGLTKPAQSDLYNIDVFNNNADAVDTNAQKTAANLATIEAVATASKPYVVGEYLVLNGILYKVTQAIANGGALVVGTNIAQDSVGTELKSIKDALPQLTIVTIAARTLTAGQTTNDFITETTRTVLSITPIWESSSDMYGCNISLYRYQSTKWYARIRNIGASSLNVPAIRFYIVTTP